MLRDADTYWVKPLSAPHVWAALNTSQVARIKSLAFVVAAVVPVGHDVLVEAFALFAV